ncbi:MAG: beta strand repeat-containing protein, partial [Undibacterium sp.]
MVGLFVFSLAVTALTSIVQRVQAATGINQQISFQGKVVNTNGTNVANGNYDFVFKLYTVSSAGSPVWTETRTSGDQVTVTDGIFQVNLGSVTALPGSIDFNTDNIYLGIEFNGDGEMSPRVRFTAAPYAFNAKKVGGLTVTDTTGTLTIPNGKTISFADAFATSGAFPLTLTSTASTTATLPSGTITLADLTTAQSLTNKTIGSTGLTFSGASTDITTATNEDLTVVANGSGIINLNDSVTSGALTISGATTDITTASGESLVIVANGAGVVDIQDATTVDSLTVDTGGVSIASGQSYTGAGAVTLSSATASDLTLNSGTTGTINIGTDASAETINIGNTGAAVKTIAIGNNSQANTITIGDASATTVSITDNNWSINASGVASFITGSTIGSQTFTTNNIADSGALTIKSAAGANALTLDSGTTGTVNLGTSNNAKTLNIATGTAGNTVNLGTDNTTKDTINIGSALDDVAITGDQWSITNAGVLTVASCSGCGGGGGTLDSAYTAGNTIGTDSGSNVIINLADVATPTEVTINNLDPSGTNALQIDNSTTLTNGLFVEQSAAGTLTNALSVAATAGTITSGLLIADGAGAITNGIQLTGTFTTTLLDTPSLDITGAGAITGATGVSTTTVTASSTIDAQGDISDSTGNLTLNDAVDISGALVVSGTTLTATSATTITLGSTGADTIILGNAGADTITIGNVASTGVSIVDNNWSVTTTGVATFITGTVIGSQTFTTNNIADSGALTIASGSGTALTLNSGTNGAINIGTDTGVETINIGNTGAAVKTIAIGNNSQANTITIGDAS